MTQKLKRKGLRVGTTVKHLDYSGWSDEQLERKARLDWRHPLQNALQGVKPESIQRSHDGEWRMSSRDFGNGYKECALWLHKPDLQKTLDRAIERDAAGVTERGEGDREASSIRAARRAKQRVRHLCKAMAVNSLWTLTYRANVVDRELVLRHLDAFRRRVVEVLGEWKYVAVLEKQERGALHIHLATHALPVRLASGGVKVKSWDVMRAIWRRVVGELGGNFDEAKRVRRYGSSTAVRGASAIASYIGGYVAKDMRESELNRKRYSVSKGVELPEAVRDFFAHDTAVIGLIELAFAAVGNNITRTFFCKESMVFYVESDDSGG